MSPIRQSPTSFYRFFKNLFDLSPNYAQKCKGIEFLGHPIFGLMVTPRCRATQAGVPADFDGAGAAPILRRILSITTFFWEGRINPALEHSADAAVAGLAASNSSSFVVAP